MTFLHLSSCQVAVWILCCLFVAAGFNAAEGYASSNEDTVKENISNHKMSPRVMEFQKRLNCLLSPIAYAYSPAGKPDPFHPFLRSKPAPVAKRKIVATGKRQRPQHCDTPLECMDVGQLRLVAIVIEGDGENMAMAQDASGIGYVLTAGMPIGYRNGQVVKILSDRVVVEEESEDIRGEMILTQRVLFLHPEEK